MRQCFYDDDAICTNKKSPETFGKRCIEADNLLKNEQTYCRCHIDFIKPDEAMLNEICLYLFNGKCAHALCAANNKSCVQNSGESCVFFISRYMFEKHVKRGIAQPDAVNHPNNYCQGDIECIKAIEASMTPEEFQGYCKGNVMKYIWRFREKNGLEDLKKAQVYLGWMIKSKEKQEKTNVN